MLTQVTHNKTTTPHIVPSGASQPGGQAQALVHLCNVFIGAEPRFAIESGQVSTCFQNKNMSVQNADIILATHLILFITDSFLKSKEYVLPLISKLADPHFKQRLFPVIMDKTLSIFSPGSELNYAKYWAEILLNTNPSSSEYKEIKTIEENIAPLIRAVRDTLMPSLNELLQKGLSPVIETIEKRSHLLQKKRFFFLPSTRATIGQEVPLAQLAMQFGKKHVVTVGGETGMGKSSLAIEYSKRSERYSVGIFWLDATNVETLEESYRQLAEQLGTSIENAKSMLQKMEDVLLIYDNVADVTLVPSFSFAHTLIIGSKLPECDIVMTSFTDEDAARFIKEHIEVSPEDARPLASVLENHPGMLSDAIAYIKSSKMSIQNYVNFYLVDKKNLFAKQAAFIKTKEVLPIQQRDLVFNVDPLEATIEKYSNQSVNELARQTKDLGIQIFVSYNWGSKTEVEQLDEVFKSMEIELLRDTRELRNFDSIREFMKKVIRQADYTFSLVTDSYIKSFNCLFEVITTLQDPCWRSRVFPIVLANTNLDDTAILAYGKYWQEEAARLSTGGTSSEAAIALEGAQKIMPYLHFVRKMQSESFTQQFNTQFQKIFALMLARQEKLEKKGVYRQGIFYLSQGRNKDFTGRERELSVLENSLKRGQYSAITNTGMGGIGKSQLALEYAYRHEKEYELIYWINSETMESLKSDLRMLGQEMGISEDFLKEDKLIFTMKSEMEKRKDWLLVYDNAEDPKALLQVMPQRGGHILVTSRNPNWANTVSVEVFNEDEALCYLQKISGASGQDSELKLLAQELGFLPLALLQAGAYIRRQQIDVATYLVAFKEEQKHMLSQHEKGYPGNVGTAWLLSMEKIAQEDPNAVKLLNICSYLAPDNIPEEVLGTWLKKKNKQDSGLDFQDALRILESYSLINQKIEHKDGKQRKLISIHRLIQTVTRDKCEQAEAVGSIELGIRVLNQQFKGEAGTKEQHEASDSLIKHAMALLTYADKQNLISEQLGNLTNKVGEFLRDLDELESAKVMHEKALKTYTAALGENSMEVAVCYNNLGSVLHDQNSLQDAIEMHKKALNIKIALLGESDINVATSYNNLGSVFQTQGNLKSAKEMHEKVLKIFIAELGENNLSVATSYNNLGTVLHAQGELKDAMEMHEKALKIQIAKQGENHINVANSYSNLGTVLYTQGNLKDATEMFEKALKIEIAVLGENHTVVASSYNSLGAMLQDKGNLNDAKEMHEKALKIRIKVLGKNHISVAESYNNLGVVFYAQKNLKDAIEMYEKALEIYIAVLGENHSNVATSYNNIGTVLEEQDNKKGALEMYEKALKIQISLEKNPINIATSYNNLGSLFYAQGNLKDAKEMHEKALKIRITALGENHIEVAQSHNNLGAILKAQGNSKGAIEMYEKALKTEIATLGESHKNVADGYHNLGDLLAAQGNLKGALEKYDKSLKIYITVLGKNNTTVADNYHDLANMLEAQENLKGAKEMLEQALKIRISKLGESHPRVADNYACLGGVLYAQGEFKGATEMHHMALKIHIAAHGENHIDVATCYNNLGTMHSAQRNFKNAIEMHEKALKIRIILFGENNSDVAQSYINLGIVLIDQRNLKGAIELYKKALKIRIAVLGENDINVAATYNTLGHMFKELGEFKDSKAMHENALKIKIAVLGENHMSVATSYKNLGAVLLAQGNLIGSKEMYEKMLKITKG